MGLQAEKSAGLIQLDFDSLEVPADDPGAHLPDNQAHRTPLGTGEMYRSAQSRRRAKKPAALPSGFQQATLDELFAASNGHTPAATKLPESQTTYEQLRQLDFDSLADVPAEDGGTVPQREPAGDRSATNGTAVQRPVVPSGDRTADEVSIGLGDSGSAVPLARRSVIFDAAEPRKHPSRDFRITEAHGVGTGGLHEKARANIAAIRLVKVLEAENRAATDEEKAVLVRYAGWGALANVFEPPWRIKQEWRASATELQHLLTEEEYESARATTPNAHFTSPLVINAIWHGLQKLGVSGNIEVLEPAMGIGHFFGFMPDMLSGGHRTGVELDALTARIAQKLYPDTTIFAQGFEATPLPDTYFDVIVGNVPFGNYGVHDPAMKKTLTRSIHDYFFAKSLDKLRPGGILAFITSRYTLDKQDTTIREYLAEQADLLAAIRLPNTAFKDNAGTEVTTDILFLQKRRPGQQATGEGWIETQPIDLDGLAVPLNEYYLRHPDMLLGQMQLTGSMYRGHEPTLTGELTPDSFQQAIAALPQGIYAPRTPERDHEPVAEIAEPEQLKGIKDGGYGVVEGRIVIRNGVRLEPLSLSAMETMRVRGLLHIRDAVREVFATQLADAPEEQIIAARQELNRVYDQFVSRFGSISTSETFRVFARDPDYPLLLSLETYDPQAETATKTAVFARRTLERYTPVEQVETASEALAVSLNEVGGISWERMAALTGLSATQLQTELGGQVYQNPEGSWETADDYLSGDVRAKLKTAEAAAAINPMYARNVEALTAVQPEDIFPGEINARLGASWIPTADIVDFIAETLHVPHADVAVSHSGQIATWSVKLDFFAQRTVSNTTTYGTERITAAALIEEALNVRVPTIYDTLPDETRVINQTATIAAREAQQKLKDRFSQWIWEDSARTQRLARIYNDTFNTIRLRTYDGSHLTFPGMNKSGLRLGDLDPHQKNAVWRMIQSKHALIGHCVGAGKTNEIAAACMELKRIGLAKKPMIVVPNHLVEQWGAAFVSLYPQANIFVAGKDFFSSGNREKAMARIATGSFDAVIISHKSFESLPVADETFNRFVNRQMDSLEEAIQEAQAEQGDTKTIVKQLEKAKKRLEAKMKDRAKRENKDNGVSFEQLGIDRLFVDEADLYKNLGFTTKMQRIAGLPNTESNRAMDMYMKSRYVSERGGGIVFATGTPISNTMAEMYTLMRYLAPELLEASGVSHFDAWAANFGEAVTALELAPDGSGYRMHTRFAKFVNLPELLSHFHTFADIQTAEMLNLPRPDIAGGKAQVIVSPPSPQLKTYVSTLVERAQQIRRGGVDPRVDNMLKITTDGRKAALDMRLVDASVTPDEETKVSKVAQQVYQLWLEGKDERLTQAVFCDISTPHPERFNAYDELRERLLSRGVPVKEIAYIHDADTDAKKKTLFDSVNAGQVRILFGSTEKMGAGTNIQKRLVALHHVDAPWRPRDIEQRDGRILRQGNENKAVHIYRYVTEGSFDAYMWQTLETKARFIQQVMSGAVTVREAEDVETGALSYAEIKAIASGNPDVVEKIRIDTEVRRLDMLRAAHINQHYDISRQVQALPERIAASKELLVRLLKDRARRDEHEQQAFTMTIAGKMYAGDMARKNAGEAIHQVVLSSLWAEREVNEIGSYKGFSLMCERNGTVLILYVRGENGYEAHLNTENPLGTIASIEHALRGFDRLVEKEQAEIERKEKALTDYRAQLHRPFEHEDRLRALLLQQQELNRKLDLDKSETQVVDEAAQEEHSTDHHPQSVAHIREVSNI